MFEVNRECFIYVALSNEAILIHVVFSFGLGMVMYDKAFKTKKNKI